ncbi:hypothetical protein [Spirochaeta dissipatitropha]
MNLRERQNLNVLISILAFFIAAIGIIASPEKGIYNILFSGSMAVFCFSSWSAEKARPDTSKTSGWLIPGFGFALLTVLYTASALR